MKRFPRFSSLPSELQLSIWEAAISSPSMHVFDLCTPGADGEMQAVLHAGKRAAAAFRGKRQTGGSKEMTRYDKFKDTVFFDALPDQHDPSMYRWKMALASACLDAAKVASAPGPGAADGSVNSVYLPGPDRRIYYDNRTDVLHLCLGRALICPIRVQLMQETELAAEEEEEGPSLLPPAESLTLYENTAVGLLDLQWSPELADTIRMARRIAVDASQTDALVKVYDNPIFDDEMHMLASTMACGLEVLYLVDYCISGRCEPCGRDSALMRPRFQTKKGTLYRGLNTGDLSAPGTPADKIYGVGTLYTEERDLERLGWTELHPAYIFGRALGRAIREQQAEDAGGVVFKGVKVLVVEGEQKRECDLMFDIV